MRSKSEQPNRRNVNVQFAFGISPKTAAEKDLGIARQLAGTQLPDQGRLASTVGRTTSEAPTKMQRDNNGRARSLSRGRDPAETSAATGGTNLEDNGPARDRGQVFPHAEGQQRST